MEDLPSRRLILVSNRLPYQLLDKSGKITLKQSDGGLVTALKSFFESAGDESFDEKIWLGSADFPERRWMKYQEHNPGSTDFRIEPLFVDAKVYNKYYNGFCNATLWPLFHYFTSYVVYDEDAFQKYYEVNKMFAERLMSFAQPNDTIWVHDYQLFLLPGMIRDRIPGATIGFFLHIPFPTYEIFRLLHKKWKDAIIHGIMGSDLIGFHTHEYVQHFLKTVRMVMGYDHQYRDVALNDRLVKVDLFPLGIDYNKFHGATKDESIVEKRNAIRDSFGDLKVIFSVDRLDYTKGVTHRLEGFARFLERYPDWREKVVFVLAVVPSRQIISKYNERRKLIEEQVGRINGKYSTLQWQPVIYRYNHVPFDELCALYQVADIGLLTPLRDGMNLVAKEYIASRPGHTGILILSELAGAANELGEALLVNPMDADEMSQAIHTALNMTESEQYHRLALMQKRLIDYDVKHWVDDFLGQLNGIKEEQKAQQMKFISKEVLCDLMTQFNTADTKHFFLDYDGTLVPFARHPREASPSREVIDFLKELSALPNTEVTLISGRDHSILQEWFGSLAINMVAEHGASVRMKGMEWMHKGEIDQSWKPAIRPTLELFVKRCPGSFVEEKNHTLAWHYRNVEPELGFNRSRELLDSLYHLVRNAHLQVIDGNKVIEIRVSGVDKGQAARKILAEHPASFVIAIGDDKTDEDMFKLLNDSAVTVKVGQGPTTAAYCIPTQANVLEILTKFIPVTKTA